MTRTSDVIIFGSCDQNEMKWRPLESPDHDLSNDAKIIAIGPLDQKILGFKD